jgi:UDP-N-acetylmuramoylalanine--D-glutamate ligase
MASGKFLDKKIGVFGLGKSGLAAINFLKNEGANVIAWDDNQATIQTIGNKFDLKNLSDKTWAEIEILVLSPGIPLNFPEPHPVVNIARANNAKIISDIELLYLSNPQAKFVGITGTNGKSTTTSLTAHILKENNINTEVGGNLGIPALSLNPLSSDGVYVLEMSSFQLDLLEETKFNIAVLLNITPDHIDRHGNIENYIEAKLNIFRNQTKDDVAIICIDNEICAEIYEQFTKENKPAKIIPISAKRQLEHGVSVIGKIIYNNVDDSHEAYEIGELKRLPGSHNDENIAASFAVSCALGLSPIQGIAAIRSFSGLPHRMQYVGEKANMLFINDSKATNAEAAEKALLSYEKNIYWILGGVQKEGGIKTLEPLFSRVKHAFLIGKAQDDFAATLDGQVAYDKCNDLSTAFVRATEMAKTSKEQAIILLSPACASYDQWKNFEERGKAFCKLAEKIILKNSC